MKRLMIFLVMIVSVALLGFGIMGCADSSSPSSSYSTPDESPPDQSDTDESIPPSAPADVSATAGDGVATISWGEVSDASSYNIYWSTSTGVNKENGTKISNVSSPYTHSGLTNGTTYYYVVTAVNDDGESEESNEVSAMPTGSVEPPPPVAPTNVSALAGNKQVTIAWDEVDEATSYNIYWDTISSVSKENGTKISNVSSPYTHSGLTNGTTYYYVVTAVNDDGESEESNEVSAMPADSVEPPPPVAPTDVSATAGDGVATISWGEVSDASSYNIYWSTSTGVNKENGTKISNVSSPYTHSGLTNGTTYYYVVTAVNDDGESEKSEEVSAMPTEPAEFWIKVFNKEGEDAHYSNINTIQLTNNGYIYAGTIKGTQSKIVPWVGEIDSDGNLFWWQKEYRRCIDSHIGLTGEEFTLVEKIPDGYLVARNYILEDSAKAIWIMKLDLGGNIVWEKAFAAPDGKDLKLASMNILPTDNGYIISCQAKVFFGWKVVLLEISHEGEIIWSRNYETSAADYLRYIQEVSSGGYIAVGWTWTGTDYDLWVVRLDSQFDVIWDKRYGGTELDYGNSVREIDNGFLVNAGTRSFGAGNYDAWILHLDSAGNILWQKTYGGSLDDYLYLAKKIDDQYVIIGGTESFGGGKEDGWIVVLDDKGKISWQKTYGGTDEDGFSDIKLSDDGALLAVGYVNEYAGLFKLNEDGYTEGSCGLIRDSNATITDTDVVPVDTVVTIETVDINVITAQPTVTDTNVNIETVCPQ